jgi:phosphoglycolate phosphatase-like HAD superfamily hydrolase
VTDGPARGAALFDVDGTLVDTTYLHAAYWAEALRQCGRPVPMSTVHHAIGMGSDRLLDYLLGEVRDRGDDSAFDAAHKALYKQHWGRLTPLPGAAALVGRCADAGLRVVLASSAARDELRALRSALDAENAIAEATSASDAAASKPEPDIVQVALHKVGALPDRSAFVGDSVWDGQAAARSGVAFVAVTCGGTNEAQLYGAGAVEVWRDPADLLEHFEDSLLSRLAKETR